ncbi:hypothetical protein M758_2G080900 [Ceratodon purpureus]|nr:hypothetical protein M758_2G080900 [Ceratodon purpureus]
MPQLAEESQLWIPPQSSAVVPSLVLPNSAFLYNPQYEHKLPECQNKVLPSSHRVTHCHNNRHDFGISQRSQPDCCHPVQSHFATSPSHAHTRREKKLNILERDTVCKHHLSSYIWSIPPYDGTLSRPKHRTLPLCPYSSTEFQASTTCTPCAPTALLRRPSRCIPPYCSSNPRALSWHSDPSRPASQHCHHCSRVPDYPSDKPCKLN